MATNRTIFITNTSLLNVFLLILILQFFKEKELTEMHFSARSSWPWMVALILRIIVRAERCGRCMC